MFETASDDDAQELNKGQGNKKKDSAEDFVDVMIGRRADERRRRVRHLTVAGR